MSSIYVKDGRIYFRVKDAAGKWGGLPSSFLPGQEKQARASLAKAEARRAAGETLTGNLGPVTMQRFFATWIENRKEHVGTWANDESVMRLHILPSLGSMRLDAVRPLHLVQLVRELRKKPVDRKYADAKVRNLAPKSVHNIYGTVSAFFRDARLEDLIGESPCILTKHQLGEKVDADPEWRATAIYSRLEVERLISEAVVSMDRRVAYALEAIGALRHGEMAGLRFRNLADADPLGMIIVARSYHARTKTRVTRYMPIHPTLAAMLAEWKLYGWAEMMGRSPTPDDLVVPLPMDLVQRNQHKPRPGGMRSKGDSHGYLKNDLVSLGMRHRRGHDLRRTMISLARSDGASRDILRRGTHKPPKEVMEGYTTFEWDVLCREVSKFKISRHRTAEVVALPRAVGGGAEDLATPLATTLTNGPETHRNSRGATRIRTGAIEGGTGDSSVGEQGKSGVWPQPEYPGNIEKGGGRKASRSNVASAPLRARLRLLLTRYPEPPVADCARCAEPLSRLLRRGREEAA